MHKNAANPLNWPCIATAQQAAHPNQRTILAVANAGTADPDLGGYHASDGADLGLCPRSWPDVFKCECHELELQSRQIGVGLQRHFLVIRAACCRSISQSSLCVTGCRSRQAGASPLGERMIIASQNPKPDHIQQTRCCGSTLASQRRRRVVRRRGALAAPSNLPLAVRLTLALQAPCSSEQ